MSTIYELHFTKPLPQKNNKRGTCAGHYLGITDDLDGRLKEHASGNGSKLCAAAVARGATLVLVRVWKNATRANELELKRQRNNPRHCYLCNPKGTTRKANLHGDNTKFNGWGRRGDYAKNHLPVVPITPDADDELPF